MDSLDAAASLDRGSVYACFGAVLGVCKRFFMEAIKESGDACRF
jgi:hypothetical protein